MTRSAKATIAAILLAACLASAQDKKQGPTYEETRKWIVNKIAEAGYKHTGGISEDSGSYENVSMDDCRLAYSKVWVYSVNGNQSHYKDETQIPLRQVKANDIEVKQYVMPNLGWNDWGVDINAPVGTEKSTKTKPGVAGEQITNHSNVGGQILFGRTPATNEDNANRLKKALEHAVELCKTQVEPF